MKYIGQVSWRLAIIFWALIFGIGILLSLIFAQIQIAYLMTFIGFVVFVFLAHYLKNYGLSWIKAIAAWGLALIIDWAIMFVIFILLGFSFNWILGI